MQIEERESSMWVFRVIATAYGLFGVIAGAIQSRVEKVAASDAGEGVVSAAIAVLIFAFLGVILWVAFKATMGTATTTINAQVARLGQ